MTRPPVIFGDPESLQIDYLAAAFAGRSEPYKPATITPNFPASALTASTHVQVELEVGNSDDYPVTERAQVRFTCYAPPGERTWVKALASLTQALVLSQPGDDAISGAFPRIGRSDVTTDPDTKNLMCWFIVRVDLKATLLAS